MKLNIIMLPKSTTLSFIHITLPYYLLPDYLTNEMLYHPLPIPLTTVLRQRTAVHSHREKLMNTTKESFCCLKSPWYHYIFSQDKYQLNVFTVCKVLWAQKLGKQTSVCNSLTRVRRKNSTYRNSYHCAVRPPFCLFVRSKLRSCFWKFLVAYD